MDDQSSENLTPVDIFQIARNIQDGTANLEDAKCLMELFCYFVDKEVKPTKGLFGYRPDELMPKELLWHFRDVLKSILEGKTPEQALGIVGRPGRATKTEFHINVATEYLKLAIKDKKTKDIKTTLEDKFDLRKSAIEGIFKKYKVQALMQLRDEREKKNPMRLISPDILWKTEEKKRLEKLYPWKAKDKKRLEENRNPMRNKKIRSKAG